MLDIKVTEVPVIEVPLVTLIPSFDWSIMITDNSNYRLINKITGEDIICHSCDLENILRK